MNAIRDFFVGAHAWQICLLLVAPYAVYKLTAFGHTPLEWGLLVSYFLLVMLGWLLSVGLGANARLDPGLRMPATVLAAVAVVPFVALAVFLFAGIIPVVRGEIPYPPQWMIYLNFLALLAVGYCVWFAARQFTRLRHARDGRVAAEVGFIDYYPAFMAFWFCVIGVWFMQPAIREYFTHPD